MMRNIVVGVLVGLSLFIWSAEAESQDRDTGTRALTAWTNETCDTWAEIPVNNNNYLVRNNVFGPGAGEQCIQIKTVDSQLMPGFKVISADHSAPHNDSPSAYPSIVKGCHPWGSECTRGWLHKRLQGITSATSRWIVGGTNAEGTWNLTYDLWINPSTDTSGEPTGTELMIWLRSKGTIIPGGTKVATMTIREKINGLWQPVNYEVYHASPWSNWQHYVAYKRTQPTNRVDPINLKDALDDCVSRGWCDSQSYLGAIEAGFEIWDGGVGLKTQTFSASVR